MTWDAPDYTVQTPAESPEWHGPPKSICQLKGNYSSTWGLWFGFRPLAFGHWNPTLTSTSGVLKCSPNPTTILVKGDSVSAKVTWCYVRCPKVSPVDIWFIKNVHREHPRSQDFCPCSAGMDSFPGLYSSQWDSCAYFSCRKIGVWCYFWCIGVTFLDTVSSAEEILCCICQLPVEGLRVPQMAA